MDYKIISVHGTFSGSPTIRGNQWWQKDSPFSKEVLSYLGEKDGRVFWEPFVWSGENSMRERYKAGVKLAEQVKIETLEPQKIVCLCHSHGGNVFRRAEFTMGSKDEKPRSITVGTPYLHEEILPFKFIETGGHISFYFVITAMTLLKLLELPPLIDVTLYFLIAIGLFLWLIRLSLPTYISIAGSLTFSKVARAKSWANPLQWFVFVLNGLTTERYYDGMVSANLKHVKIFSMFDEVISSLGKAHRQKIELANRRNSTLPSAVLWAAIVFVVVLLLLLILGVDPWHGTTLERFTFFNERRDQILRNFSPYFLRTAPNFRNDYDANVMVDIFLLAGLSYVAGQIISFTPASLLFVKLFNGNLETFMLNRAFGRDVTTSWSNFNLISPNLPILHGDYKVADKWRALPPDFDESMNSILDAGAVETMRSIRETIAVGVLAGGFNLFESVARNFSGDELVHTSYFRHPEFAAFIAWILVHELGFHQVPSSKNCRTPTCIPTGIHASSHRRSKIGKCRWRRNL